MPAVVVVGAQWGDEGKGKVVDLYARHADAVVRYAGGANAGHTLVVGGEQVILHLVPSGILNEETECVVAQGTVLDPDVLLEEIATLEARGISVASRLHFSERAHVVLPHHKLIDSLRENKAGAIGTTKRGIGPCYEDKVARRGIRLGDLLQPKELRSRLARNIEAWRPVADALGGTLPAPDEVATAYAALGQRLRPFVCDTARLLSTLLSQNKNVMLEGAQGTLLDIDHGTYPFVTSSTAVAGGACSGAGIGPTDIDGVVGIAKAYATRVGHGPFPTELENALGERLRQAGSEFGATTGRPRRCGWFDAPALRLAVRVNGMTRLALTKLDVLTGIDPIQICTHYDADGQPLSEPSFDSMRSVTPVYESMPGWSQSLRDCATIDDLPEPARAYVHRLEELVGCPISLVSVGPGREHSLGEVNPFTELGQL